MGAKITITREWSVLVRAEMELLWATCEITDPLRFERIAARCRLHRCRYRELGESLGGIPWWFIACVHMMESGGSWSKHLHNGDPLKARTVNVPRGRPKLGNPPFAWRESAADALTMKGFHTVQDWSIAHALWLLERYNGLGYRLYRGIHSPYLWSGTNHYVSGKYVADGMWSATAVSQQAGAAGLIRILCGEEIQ